VLPDPLLSHSGVKITDAGMCGGIYGGPEMSKTSSARSLGARARGRAEGDMVRRRAEEWKIAASASLAGSSSVTVGQLGDPKLAVEILP
jgi:hypothetical protein